MINDISSIVFREKSIMPASGLLVVAGKKYRVLIIYPAFTLFVEVRSCYIFERPITIW